MRRKHTVILAAGLALLALFIGARFIGRGPATAPAGNTPPQKSGAAPLPVYTHRVDPRMLREIVTATGAIRAGESIDLVSEFTGKVIALEFAEGAEVARGDLLVKLDDDELRAQLERARHRVELAGVQAERQRELLAAQGTTRQNYDAAVSEQRVLQAEVELIRAQLAKTEIRAPFAGVIGLRYVSIGSFVDPSTRIATLQNLEELKVDFAVAERHMSRLAPGASVEIALAGRSEPLAGRLYAVEPQIDPATRTIQLRARAKNPGGIMPGAFATVRLALRAIPDALLVPANALVPGLNEQSLFVLEDGRARSRNVQTGLRLAREVQITSGLEPGAIVITSGQLQLQSGVAVRAVTRPDERADAARPQ